MTRFLPAILAVAAFLGSTAARADRWSLEGGLSLSGYVPTGSRNGELFGGAGFVGEMSYEIEYWGFGVRGRGSITNATNLSVQAGSYDLNGSLTRRVFGIEAFVRYFFLNSTGNKSWYLEASFEGLETEFVHAQDIFVLPQSQDYTRLFLRGAGFTFGAGFRPKNGPWFFQVNYELSHYESLYVVADVKNLHPVIDQPDLNGNYFINSVFVIVGLDVFGR